MKNSQNFKSSTKKNILKNMSLSYSLARTTAFTVQSLALPLIDKLISKNRRQPPKDFSQHLIAALPKIQKLLENDSQNIANGLYPIQVLSPESVVKHSLRFPRILFDAYKSANRRNKKVNNQFDEKAQQFLSDMPDYYKRNFHFQTSGYLGEESAELYDHQVEILFSGSANAMRRLMIAPIKTHLHALEQSQESSLDGAGLKFLEIGCGTGSLTKSMALAFPKAQITCLDLSSIYLSKAKENLSEFKRVDFIQGAGEALPFVDESFDVVYSCFLFHELPKEIREKVIKESQRVAKQNGLIGAVDSLQENDDVEFQWALEQFPQDFHEPFYKNYTQNSLEDLLTEAGLVNVQSGIGFLAKVVSAVKV